VFQKNLEIKKRIQIQMRRLVEERRLVEKRRLAEERRLVPPQPVSLSSPMLALSSCRFWHIGGTNNGTAEISTEAYQSTPPFRLFRLSFTKTLQDTQKMLEKKSFEILLEEKITMYRTLSSCSKENFLYWRTTGMESSQKCFIPTFNNSKIMQFFHFRYSLTTISIFPSVWIST